MDEDDREQAQLEPAEPNGSALPDSEVMVFEKQESAVDFVGKLSQVDVDAQVVERQHSHDESNLVDRATAGRYWVIVPAPGQGFAAEIYYDLQYQHGVAPTALAEAGSDLKRGVMETLLVRRATLAGKWQTPAPCSKGDIDWYAETAGLSHSEVSESIRDARQSWEDNQRSERNWSMVFAAGLCALGGLFWLTGGLGIGSGMLIAAGVALGIFALTHG